jgi:hypothetical protein
MQITEIPSRIEFEFQQTLLGRRGLWVTRERLIYVNRNLLWVDIAEYPNCQESVERSHYEF